MNTQRGFSLIELLVTLGVAGVLMAVGIAGFGLMHRTLFQASARDRLIQDLRLARQLAVTRHRMVHVAFGDGVATTDLTTYALHVDDDGDVVRDPGEYVINRGVPDGARLGQVSLQPPDSVRFDPSGLLAPGTDGGLIVIVHERGQPDSVAISATGMVSGR